MLKTAEKPSQLLRRFDFFKGDLLRIIHQPEEQMLEIVASSLAKLHCHFHDMLWDVRRGAWTEEAQGKVILVDAETGGQFEFYDPFPDG